MNPEENSNIFVAEDGSNVENNETSNTTELNQDTSTISVPENTNEPISSETQQNEPETIVAAVSDNTSSNVAENNSEEQKSRKIARQEHFDNIFKELLEAKEKGEPVEVEVKNRIRGGLRVIYKDFPMFLPTSHFSLKRTPSEQDMQDIVGQTFMVNVHEYQEYDEGRKAVIVSRKSILLKDAWKTIKVGEVIEGKISSVASFGVFLEFNGVEGLIHVSRLSKAHIDNPNKYYNRGDTLSAIIIEIDEERQRIALSRKELEESPWKDVETLFPIGAVVTGKVRRLVDFGAYVELKPGVDGLLRLSELSWTKRIKKPSDVVQQGMEIQVEVLSISEEKQIVSLSYKKTLPNPWKELPEKYPVGSEYEGTVLQVIPQGVIVSVSEEVDGFMPRSKMRDILRGRKIPFQVGDKMNIIIADINPDEQSIILAPKFEADAQSSGHDDERLHHSSYNNEVKPKQNDSTAFSLVDLISDKEKANLFNTLGQ